MKTFLLVAFFFLAFSKASPAQSVKHKPISRADFLRLMQTVADGLNENNGRKAADCFALDAIYSEPPNKQIYRGRDRIFEFFGGFKGRPKVAQMVWHHLAFDEQTQIGSGEFSLTYDKTVHGMVSVRIRDGLIGNWREYFYQSALDWNGFVLQNPF
ncbi:nuclear transport factor 2 family protein [Larkinella sp. VNQ87]|uniref:nuclear transport factor 2 family protein n=1 Tax=Larkinella sp. VNQ87 TaxID=3400921 RepID=UPI003C018F48